MPVYHANAEVLFADDYFLKYYFEAHTAYMDMSARFVVKDVSK